MTQENVSSMTELHLEPRVARLETGLETLTRNVGELASSIRDNANATNIKLDSLAIAVTQAAAPKKTDWALFISIGFFILALGSAVFWPLNKGLQDNKDALTQYHSSMVEHLKLDMHPVGQAKVIGLEKALADTKQELVARDAAIDTKSQRDTSLITDLIAARLADLDIRLQREFNLVNDRNLARLLKLEDGNRFTQQQNELELRAWRNKVNGLSSPDK